MTEIEKIEKWLKDENYPSVMTMTFENLAIVINNFLRSNTVAPVDNIRWVKASERLPDDDSVKHIRHKLGSDFWIPDTGYYRKAKHWFECDRGRQIFEIDKIEWLEEQTNPVDNTQSEEEKQELKRKIHSTVIPKEVSTNPLK